MERSKDRIQGGYRDYDSRMQREDARAGRYQNSFEGEDIYNEIMQAGRSQNTGYQSGYDPIDNSRQNYDQGYDGYDPYENAEARISRNQRDPQTYNRNVQDPYQQREMANNTNYGYNNFNNESIDSLLDNDYQQPMKNNRVPYDQGAQYNTNQYSTGQFYPQQQEPVIPRSRAVNNQLNDPYGNPAIQQTSPFTFNDTAAPRQRLKQSNDPRSIQNTQSNAYPNDNVANDVARTPRKAALTLSEEYEMSRKQKKKKEKQPKIKSEKKAVKEVVEKIPGAGKSYKSFTKWNLLIFLIAMLNIVLITLSTASLVYSNYFNNFALQSDIVQSIITYCLIISALFAYNAAGLHCGYFMFKDKLDSMKTVFKVLLFPILLIVLDIVGFICEIPYLIYCFVKAGD